MAIGVLLATPACGRVQPPLSLSPEAQALRAEVSDERLVAFYESRNWQFAWTPNARADLNAALENAAEHGIEGRVELPSYNIADPVAVEVAYTRTAFAYADALARGLVDPTEFREPFTLARNEVDVAAGLQDALAQRRLEPWFEGLAPQDQEYRQLSSAYLRARDAIASAEQTTIAEGELIHEGERDARVPAIAQALEDEGYLSARTEPTPENADLFDAALADALKQFQRDRGMADDGIFGPNAREVLNRGPFERARQLAVNLERRRWLARTAPAHRVDVNTAANRLYYYMNDTRVWTTRVVSGAPGHVTPQLQETFDQLVVNPPWNVPQSIAEEEILPRGEDYLARNNMYIEDGRVIQRPGPNAALGLVKFNMLNRWAIYLHDTPAKALFEASQRHRSHGCVRVRDAVDFARRLARDDGREAEFNAALASGETQIVELSSPIGVRLMYHTALVENGAVRLVQDSYGWDEEVAERMGLGDGARRSRAAVTALLGP
ncbi:MAG: L,D-transpeptidase family protein [Hyphomonadaceae bacterium]